MLAFPGLNLCKENLSWLKNLVQSDVLEAVGAMMLELLTRRSSPGYIRDHISRQGPKIGGVPQVPFTNDSYRLPVEAIEQRR